MNVSEDDMDNWMVNRIDDVYSLHAEINNLNDLLVGFCFIRDIDCTGTTALLFLAMPTRTS